MGGEPCAMRLGGPLFGDTSTPDLWADTARRHGYRAVFCPVDAAADDATVAAYARAAATHDLVIAEVGAWSNPLSDDPAVRRDAIAYCQRQLDLADRIGARCCVNIAGSRGPKWDGPCADDLTDETFALIVETVREIVDAVKPTRAYYTLETMPWMFPDSPESYLDLMRAIDRERFAVHLDPVNLVNSPSRCFRNADLLRACFETLGPWIQSCHAKDIVLRENLTVHLDECGPGEGVLDYAVFLTELDRLDPDIPLMMEHLRTAEEYAAGAAHIRAVGHAVGVRV